MTASQPNREITNGVRRENGVSGLNWLLKILIKTNS